MQIDEIFLLSLLEIPPPPSPTTYSYRKNTPPFARYLTGTIHMYPKWVSRDRYAVVVCIFGVQSKLTIYACLLSSTCSSIVYVHQVIYTCMLTLPPTFYSSASQKWNNHFLGKFCNLPVCVTNVSLGNSSFCKANFTGSSFRAYLPEFWCWTGLRDLPIKQPSCPWCSWWIQLAETATVCKERNIKP